MDLTDEQKKFWAWMEFFKPEEFDSPDEPGSGLKMQNELLRAIRYLRLSIGIPLVINSGYRTEARNKAEGGEPNSAHLRGWAVDFRITNSSHRCTIVREALKLGFKRVGIANTFVHLDMDPSLPQNVIWLYS